MDLQQQIDEQKRIIELERTFLSALNQWLSAGIITGFEEPNVLFNSSIYCFLIWAEGSKGAKAEIEVRQAIMEFAEMFPGRRATLDSVQKSDGQARGYLTIR
jgi:hypothetical protein